MTEVPKKKLTVLLVESTEHGGSAHGHFAKVIRWLGEQVNLRRASSHAEAIRNCATCDPALILVLHSVPGIVPVNVEAQFEVAFPECPVAHLLGPWCEGCLLYTSPSPRDATLSRMPSSA